MFVLAVAPLELVTEIERRKPKHKAYVVAAEAALARSTKSDLGYISSSERPTTCKS